MSKKLDIDTFNEVLFSAFKEQTPKALHELYIMELQTAYSIKIQCMEKVIDDLNEGKPYFDDLQKVNNVDHNCDVLNKKIKALEEENPELKQECEVAQ